MALTIIWNKIWNQSDLRYSVLTIIQQFYGKLVNKNVNFNVCLSTL